MSRIRTFLAIDLGRPVRSRCSTLIDVLSRTVTGAKWVKPDTIHITLAFLGDVEDRDLIRVCRAAEKGCVGHAPFSLEIAGLGCFGNPKKPRTLWAGVGEGLAELKALHAALDAALVETGLYRSEEGPFEPHLTLARFKHGGPDVSADLEKHAAWAGGACEVEEVLVMSSDLKRDGPEYTVLGRAAL
jgi:2'-5' RNA ligase